LSPDTLGPRVEHEGNSSFLIVVLGLDPMAFTQMIGDKFGVDPSALKTTQTQLAPLLASPHLPLRGMGGGTRLCHPASKAISLSLFWKRERLGEGDGINTLGVEMCESGRVKHEGNSVISS